MTLSLRIVWKIALLKSGKNVGSNAENQESVSFAMKSKYFAQSQRLIAVIWQLFFWWNYKEQLPSNCISAQLSQMLSFALPLMMTMRILLLWVGQILEWVLMPKSPGLPGNKQTISIGHITSTLVLTATSMKTFWMMQTMMNQDGPNDSITKVVPRWQSFGCWELQWIQTVQVR